MLALNDPMYFRVQGQGLRVSMTQICVGLRVVIVMSTVRLHL